jgi:tetratricopeptide (TPR) repeat protein
MSDRDKLVKPGRGLSSAQWQAQAIRLAGAVRRDREVARAMLSELLARDPATWLEHLALHPAAQTPSMIQTLALAARPTRERSTADPDQMLAVAEALARIIPDEFGKVSALQELWISRGLVHRERREYPAALAALHRAALFIESPYEGLLERSEILLLEAQIHLDAGDHRTALLTLFESVRYSDETEGREHRLSLLWEIVDALKACGRH